MGNEQGRGQLILILGILGLVCCMPLGIVAWVMGAADMKLIKAGQIPESERSLTQAGMILGMVSVGLAVLVVLGYVLMFVFAMASGGPRGM